MTGYGLKEAIRAKKKIVPRCYLCKRRSGDKWIYAIAEKDHYNYFDTEMGFQWVEIIKDDIPHSAKGVNTKFRFFLCYECMLLLEAINEKFEFAESVHQERSV